MSAPDALKCADLRGLSPEHLQVVTLRIARNSWSEIAAKLRVDVSTIRRWRAEYPDIDRVIAEECADQLGLACEILGTATKSAMIRLQRIVESPASEDSDAIAAAKVLADLAKKPPPEVPGERPRARVVDVEPERDLKAELRRRLARG